MNKEQAIEALKAQLSQEGTTSAQPVVTDTNVGNNSEIPNSSDCISRQAAVDAADKIIERDTSGNNAVVNAMIAWSEYIKALPPAQPEEIALHESCTDCPLYDKGRYRCPRFNKVIPETLRELQLAQSEQRWIPCSDRMPETGVEVLTYDEALNYIEIQTFSDGRWENQRGDWQDLDDIAAWMPLPTPYRKGAAT